jgi:hypothetical protein
MTWNRVKQFRLQDTDAQRPTSISGERWQGPCRPAQRAASRPDEPTADKLDGSYIRNRREPV